jgi:hypothetical protein
MILALAYLIFLGGTFTLIRTSMLFGMGMLIFSASMMLFAVPHSSVSGKLTTGV